MKKRWFHLLIGLMLCLGMALPAQAAYDYVGDEYGVLTEAELLSLNQRASDLQQAYGVAVYMYMAEDTGDKPLADYALEQMGIGSQEDCILLVYDEDQWDVFAQGSPAAFVSEEDEAAFWKAYEQADTYIKGIADYQAAAEALLQSRSLQSAPAEAPAGYLRLMDEADLLTPEEESALLAQLDEISLRQGLDVVVVTVNGLDGKSAMDFADDYFDYNGYGQGSDRSGILLLVSMEDRDWWISTRGYGITVLTDAGLEYVSQQFLPDLSGGDYAQAFSVFAETCDSFITQANAGAPYDSNNLPRNPPAWWWLPVSLALGLVIALLVVGSMKRKLKSVRPKSEANAYIRAGSTHLTANQDQFLYSHVSKSARPKNTSSSGSSTHTSSSGASHGGGGGKF